MNGRVWILALVLASFALRMHGLLELPGFVDEGNHLLWASEIWQGRFIFPFSTAKALEIFFLAALAPFRSPLWVGRVGSVLLGAVTLSGLWALARGRRQAGPGLWAAALYAFMPWTFFHERTAVADPLVAALAVLTAWVAVRWIRGAGRPPAPELPQRGKRRGSRSVHPHRGPVGSPGTPLPNGASGAGVRAGRPDLHSPGTPAVAPGHRPPVADRRSVTGDAPEGRSGVRERGVRAGRPDLHSPGTPVRERGVRAGRGWTILLALCLFALPMAKLSAAPLMLIPAAAALIHNRSALPRLVLPYGLAIAGLALVLGAASLRYNVLGELTVRADDAAQAGWLGRVSGNMADLVQWASAYAGVTGLLMAAGGVVAVAQRSRVGLLGLAGCAVGLAMVFVPSTSFPRYFLPALAFGSLLAAEATMFALAMLRPVGVRWAAGLVVAAGVAASFLGFAGAAYRDPARLPLVQADREQHVLGWASGYAIRESAGFMNGVTAADSQPVVYTADLATRVIAWLYWTPGAQGTLHVLWDGGAPDVSAVVSGGRPAYLIVDSTRDSANFQGLNIQPREIARFERPPGGAPVIVYRLTPGPFAP